MIEYPSLEPSGIISLITDFGSLDHYVGVMKGVLLRYHPAARIVDISHGVPAFCVRSGAYLLEHSHPFFPRGTLHLVVVDPGVGTQRRAVLIQTSDHYFMGPDNGVLDPAFENDKIEGLWILEPGGLPRPSDTFHGRDLFAPVAGKLIDRKDIREHLRPMEPRQPSERSGDRFVSVPVSGSVLGEVIWIDHFGNIVTNLRPNARTIFNNPLEGVLNDHPIQGIRRTYEADPGSSPFFILGSSGYLEISISHGSAAETMKVQVGFKVGLTCG